IGAGSGLLGGAAVGYEPAYAAGWDVQQRYDTAYQQCMYAKGNQIPGAFSAARQTISAPPPPPPPGYYTPPAYPPPPPGYPSPHPGFLR
ncbi:MAG: hypothetical protein WAL90_17085, partial [Desulfobacterales bacterium]